MLECERALVRRSGDALERRRQWRAARPPRCLWTAAAWGGDQMLRRSLVGAAVAASLPFTSALADQLTVIAPEKVGLSAERLQRLTAALQGEVDAGQMPGT